MDIESSPPRPPPPPSTAPPPDGGDGGGISVAQSSSSSSSPPPPPPPPQRIVKIHPLAIIGISDHHTRVVSGGSALPRTSPVVGLLFGLSSGREVCVVDAEEMEYPRPGGGGGQQAQRDAIRKKIELHRRVFPNHAVVGWYRVRGGRGAGSSDGDDDDLGGGGGNASAMPTEEDLRVTRTEIGRYHCRSGDGDGDAGDGEGADARWGGPLFLLMDASSSAPNDKQPPPPPPPSSSSSSGNDASGEMEMDEELPLTVYETMSSPSSTGGGGVAFVNADFELETYEPERIAVERVFRTRPPKATSASAPAAAAVAAGRHEAATTGIGAAGGGPRKAGKKSKKDAEEQGRRGAGRQQPSAGSSSSSSSSAASGVGPRFARGPTDLDERLESLGSSVRAMNLRVSVLCEYLARVEGGEAEADGALLRSIDGLVRQLPLVLASLEGGGRGSSSSSSDDADSPPGRTPLREIENEYDDAMLLAYLAAVAKTARAVHVYSEKFRNTCESWKGDPHRRPLY